MSGDRLVPLVLTTAMTGIGITWNDARMSTASDDGADGAGLVLISYSHDDAKWAQRFRVLLKPLVRVRRMQLWDDTVLRAGDAWHPEIERAILRSRLALLLVSADYLASDYVMDHELPALRRHGVRLAPVLIADCFWNAVPELATVQWLHDIERDGALSLIGDHAGERDRAIRRACERLLEVTPEPALAGVAPAPALPPPPGLPLPAPDSRPATARSGRPPALRRPQSRDVPPSGPEPGPVPRSGPVVADVPEGDVAGALSACLRCLRAMWCATSWTGWSTPSSAPRAGGAVGLTGEPAGVGLHGIGGIGKSVLAAALATDDRVRRRFPGGVYWVTVGERPDVLALQLDLLSRLGVRPEARTQGRSAQALRAALADQRVLLVVDDVWSADDAQDFRVTGPRGRLLYTSRDQGVIGAAGATAHRVGVLSRDDRPGRSPARCWACPPRRCQRRPTGRSRPSATFRSRWRCSPRQCGAAGYGGRRSRGEDTGLGGRSWEEIAADLVRDADVYGTHPYATTFRALHIAVAALPDDLRAALLGLAVFPPDSAVPVAAIARYWAHTRGRSAEETVADLDRLIAAEVLQRGADTDTIGFHDLAHEYLLLHADALPTLHEQLLDAYRGLLDGSDQWWTLPLDEPYVWEHLTAHLAGAGDRDTLVATVTDPAYQAKRIARDGPHAGEADLAVAARVVREIRWSRGGGRGSVGTRTCLVGAPDRCAACPGRGDDARLAGG